MQFLECARANCEGSALSLFIHYASLLIAFPIFNGHTVYTCSNSLEPRSATGGGGGGAGGTVDDTIGGGGGGGGGTEAPAIDGGGGAAGAPCVSCI